MIRREIFNKSRPKQEKSRRDRADDLGIQGHQTGRDPFVQHGKAELALGKRFQNESCGNQAADVQVEPVYQQKGVHGGEPHSLVAVKEGVIVDQRLLQRGCLFGGSGSVRRTGVPFSGE